MKKSIIIILTAALMVLLTCHLAIADEKISPITATASSTSSSRYAAAKAVDGSMSSRWLGSRDKSPWWIKFDTGKTNSLSVATTYWYEKGYAAGSYDILVSSDNVNWTEVYTRLRGVTGGETKVINREARYIMLKIYSTQGSPMPGIKEFEAYRSVAPPNQPPTAEANANPTSGAAPLTAQFTASGSDPDGTIASYSWNFGDDGTSNEQNPSHTYQNPGTYVATLTVTDDDGASDDAPPLTITVSTPSVKTVPHLIRFQGNLGDAEGVPLDGTFTLTFALYDVETDGTPLWEEEQESIGIKDGILDVKLGSITPLDLPFDKQYWLGVQVESDSEMSPRFELTTVPYSFRSEN